MKEEVTKPLKAVMDKSTEEDFRRALNKIAQRVKHKETEADSWYILKRFDKHNEATTYGDGLLESWRIMMSVLTGYDYSDEEVEHLFIKVYEPEQHEPEPKQHWLRKLWQRLFAYWY